MLTTHVPTFPEAVLTLLAEGWVNQEEALRYFTNYETFREHRSDIETNFDGQWVAVVEGRIVATPTYGEMRWKIEQLSNWQQAYYEHVGRIV